MATFDFLPAWESRRGFNTKLQGPELMAELDAAYFHLYGIERDDAEYILSTFKGIHERTPLFPERQSTAGRILELYDEYAEPSPAR